MNPPLSSPKLSEEISRLLVGLRWRIKTYVWLEGIAVAFIWLALTFWVAYAIDYWLLVRVFAVEFPWYLRGIMLGIIAAVLGVICYRWILRRAFVAMADESMAVVLERRFAEFQDSLLTSVEMAGRPDHASEFSQEMLSRTKDDALLHVGNVRLREVFSFAPLVLSSVVAVLLLVAVGSFAATAVDHFGLAARRIYLLDTTPWPRKSTIELMGVSVERNANLVGADRAPDLLPFTNGRVRVAKGSSVTLRVRADQSRVIPDKCLVQYEDDEGNSGTVEMEKVGRPLDGFQNFRLDRQPFKNVITSFQFQVIGKNYGSIGGSDDDQDTGISLGLWPVSNRLEGYVEVVDSPIVAESNLSYVRPRYIAPDGVPTLTPYARGMTLPIGTEVDIQCVANKPLKFAHIHFPDLAETITIDVQASGGDATTFTVPSRRLAGDTSIEITLHDTDEIVSESPYRMLLGAVADEAPKVDVFLRGIGSAVTPDVRIPLAGKVSDDHGVQRAWCDIKATGAGDFLEGLQLAAQGKIEHEIDFRAKRNDEADGLTLVPAEENRLTLVVRAEDHFDLDGEPNRGKGDIYDLEIVTADQLLILLERQEAGQRERVQQVKNEMTEAHDFLLNVRARGSESAAGAEPDDAAEGAEPGDAAEAAQKVHSVRLSYAVKSLLQTRKSAQELRGVVATIRDIREQLVNNRVDAEDHKKRLQEDIADPLEALISTRFSNLEDRLAELERRLKVLGVKLEDPAAIEAVDETTQESIAEMQQLLLELEEILQKLRKIEDYNKLLTYLRELLNDQKELNERTDKRFKQQALEDLTD